MRQEDETVRVRVTRLTPRVVDADTQLESRPLRTIEPPDGLDELSRPRKTDEITKPLRVRI